MIPSVWLGYAYHDLDSDVATYYLIPFNWIIRWFWLGMYFLRAHPAYNPTGFENTMRNATSEARRRGIEQGIQLCTAGLKKERVEGYREGWKAAIETMLEITETK